MQEQDTTSDGAHVVFRCALLALALAAATNAVVAVIDAVEWAWWAAGAWALVALLLAGARSGPVGARAARVRQVPLAVDEVEPAALVRRDPEQQTSA